MELINLLLMKNSNKSRSCYEYSMVFKYKSVI